MHLAFSRRFAGKSGTFRQSQGFDGGRWRYNAVRRLHGVRPSGIHITSDPDAPDRFDVGAPAAISILDS